MRRSVAVLCLMLAGSSMSFGSDNEQKARAMLDRAIAEVKKDPPHAFELFKAGGADFRDGDIYPFCFSRSDGVVVTGQTAGKDIRTFGTIGPTMYEKRVLLDGDVAQLAYKAPRPGSNGKDLSDKVTFLATAGAYVCGVGYYK